jgi:serine/threonine protein kinase
MQNYEIKNKIAKGSQGIVYLVLNKIDKKEYAMKKILCNGLEGIYKFNKKNIFYIIKIIILIYNNI